MSNTYTLSDVSMRQISEYVETIFYSPVGYSDETLTMELLFNAATAVSLRFAAKTGTLLLRPIGISTTLFEFTRAYKRLLNCFKSFAARFSARKIIRFVGVGLALDIELVLLKERTVKVECSLEVTLEIVVEAAVDMEVRLVVGGVVVVEG